MSRCLFCYAGRVLRAPAIIMQVDTVSYKIPNFVKKAAAAGCRKVFIGLENINPESLKGASKGQNHITEYRAMLQPRHNVRVVASENLVRGDGVL